MRIINSENGFLMQILKGVITALIITLISVLIFAFILNVCNLSDKVIKPVNQFIKLISILLSCFVSVKRERFLLKGGLIGFLSAILSALLFALIAGAVTSWLTVFIDVAFGLLMGALSGLIVGKIANC
ncbi:MAG: TIGR04086 family membrane protein [Clostridia bacterium]|nr:TIGR04086 family membrane protein [Clostridia bacterium]